MGDAKMEEIRPFLCRDNPEEPITEAKGVKRSCSFYMKDKKRKCRMMAMRGQDTCVEHVPASLNGIDPRQLRINCPLDPKHTVFKYLLKKHLLKCNARKTESLHPFYSLGINSGDALPCPKSKGLGLNDLGTTELMQLIERIKTVSQLHIPETAVEIGSSKVLQEVIESPTNGHEAKRHLRQTASILNLLETEKCLNPKTCFIEFGSGKGGLTYWIAQAVEALPHPETQSFVLVDKASPRHKKDNKLQETNFNVERIRIDIKDLKLDEVSFVRKSKNLVGVSKHLCGAATDLALKCLLETNGFADRVSGIVMATCCHHLSSWGNFVGKQILQKWGFTEQDFRPLTCITSWNVCGTGTGKFSADSTSASSDKYSKMNLSLSERRFIGWNAKRILDYARCEYIKSFGLDSRYSIFVTADDTYENICIVGLARKLDVD